MTSPTYNQADAIRGAMQSITQRGRVGLAYLGDFIPPESVATSNKWTLIRDGSKKESNSFPPPINDIQWQGFYTKEVTGYSIKLFWVCGYGILNNGTSPSIVMCQWWHTEAVNITDYRLITAEDWANANIYTSPVERLEDMFINSQLSRVNQVEAQEESQKTSYSDVIEIPKQVHVEKIEQPQEDKT